MITTDTMHLLRVMGLTGDSMESALQEIPVEIRLDLHWSNFTRIPVPIIISKDGNLIRRKEELSKDTVLYMHMYDYVPCTTQGEAEREKGMYREVTKAEIQQAADEFKDTDMGVEENLENAGFWARIHHVPYLLTKNDVETFVRSFAAAKYREMSHDQYLTTIHWRDVREERLEIDGYQCKFCGSAINLNVHHITYKTKGEENPATDLITLCEKCHGKVHENDLRRKQND